MPPSARPVRPLSRRHRTRGAAAVEAAIVLPVVILVFLGVVEFGLVFKDYLGVTSAVGSSARYASLGSSSDGAAGTTFPQQAANAVAAGVVNVDMTGFQSLWIYDASTGVPTTCATSCVAYRWVAASGSTPGAFVQSGGTWVPCSPVSGVAPRVGVSIKVRHSSITAFIPANVVVSATGVFAFEPGSVPSC